MFKPSDLAIVTPKLKGVGCGKYDHNRQQSFMRDGRPMPLHAMPSSTCTYDCQGKPNDSDND